MFACACSAPERLNIIPSNEERDWGFQDFALNAVNLRLSASPSNRKGSWNVSSIILNSPVMPIGPKFSKLLIDASSGFNHPSKSQLFLSFLIPPSLSWLNLNITQIWDFFCHFKRVCSLQQNWVALQLCHCRWNKGSKILLHRVFSNLSWPSLTLNSLYSLLV